MLRLVLALNFISQGIVTAPILFAMEEYPQLRDIVDQGFDDPRNVDLVSFSYKKCILHYNDSTGLDPYSLLHAPFC